MARTINFEETQSLTGKGYGYGNGDGNGYGNGDGNGYGDGRKRKDANQDFRVWFKFVEGNR